jgi:hypothetical protein
VWAPLAPSNSKLPVPVIVGQSTPRGAQGFAGITGLVGRLVALIPGRPRVPRATSGANFEFRRDRADDHAVVGSKGDAAADIDDNRRGRAERCILR